MVHHGRGKGKKFHIYVSTTEERGSCRNFRETVWSTITAVVAINPYFGSSSSSSSSNNNNIDRGVDVSNNATTTTGSTAAATTASRCCSSETMP